MVFSMGCLMHWGHLTWGFWLVSLQALFGIVGQHLLPLLQRGMGWPSLLIFGVLELFSCMQGIMIYL